MTIHAVLGALTLTVFLLVTTPPPVWGADAGLAHVSSLNGIEIKNGFQYHLHTSSYSDYAFKVRSIALPGKQQPVLVAGVLEYPVGTKISKSFYFYAQSASGCKHSKGRVVAKMLDQRTPPNELNAPICLLETRVLTKKQQGWVPEVYLWSKEGTKAERLRLGIKIPVQLIKDGEPPLAFDYKVPSEGECRQCHQGALRSVKGLVPIGPSLPRRLDLKHSHFPLDTKQKIRQVQLSQASTSLHPGRDYMDINCSHCHNPNGAAAASALFLDSEEIRDINLGQCKPAVAMGIAGLTYDVVPGLPEKSILFQRFVSLENNMKMPEIAKSTVDPKGKLLIADWIMHLGGTCE